MTERGWLGNKTDVGFYKKVEGEGGREFWVARSEVDGTSPIGQGRFPVAVQVARHGRSGAAAGRTGVRRRSRGRLPLAHPVAAGGLRRQLHPRDQRRHLVHRPGLPMGFSVGARSLRDVGCARRAPVGRAGSRPRRSRSRRGSKRCWRPAATPSIDVRVRWSGGLRSGVRRLRAAARRPAVDLARGLEGRWRGAAPQRQRQPARPGRRRAAARVPQQGQRPRRRHLQPGGRGADRTRTGALAGAGDRQSGQALLRRRQHLRHRRRGAARRLRRHRRRHPQDARAAAVDPLRLQTGGGGALWHDARRRLRSGDGLVAGGGRGRDLHRPGRGRGRADPGRDGQQGGRPAHHLAGDGDPQRPAAGLLAAGLRAGWTGEGGGQRRRGAAACAT